MQMRGRKNYVFFLQKEIPYDSFNVKKSKQKVLIEQ